ncbi:MAG: hypothetical protein WAK82_41985, partial [Streptosporangiaceae bacterium]
GDPASLGGRSAAAARVSWITGPAGTATAPPPATQSPPTQSPQARTTVETAEPARLIAELSCQFGGEIPGLTVTRPTLEDTYLELIAEVTP